MKFIETKLNDNIKRALEDLHYDNLTSIQENTIDKILDGKDIVAMSSTGSGKTAAFMLPLINKINIEEKTIQVLVVTPTRELAIQIVQETRKFCKYMQGINSMAIYGGQDLKNQAISLRRGVKVVVGTPGRILDLINKKILKLNNLKAIVLDEADEMLSMGFYEEVNGIIEKVPNSIQKLLFSATIDNRVRDIANKKIKKAIYIECKDNDTMLVDNILQIAIDVKEKMKNECVLRILKKENSKNSVVFCNTKKKTEEVYKFLLKNKITVEMLNSDIRQEVREKTLKRLKQGKLDTIVVTDVLARGIDVEDLDLVINYDIPYEVEYYVHRIGRTARKGKSGVAYTLYTGKQIDKIREIEEYTNTKMNFESVPIIAENNEVELPISKRGLYILTINLGKKDNIKAKDIVGAIEALSGIKSDKIGLIEVREETSIIEISKEYVVELIRIFTKGKIKGKDVNIIK
jgi:ATP-dependent RNA helicase DeaD